MATAQLNIVIRHLRQAARLREVAALSDGQLLDCFLARREEAAFASLVRRHGPMVLGVCRRVLRHAQDAEDAFQATFLVLVRKGASVRPRDAVGNWLYGVAYRTSLKARALNARRRAKEGPMRELPQPETPIDDLWRDLQPILDQELHHLPDRYRAPVVLCDIEGKSRKEAAQHLGCPEGTLSSRLARGRQILAKRLTRHGLTLSAGSLAVMLAHNGAEAAVPAALAFSTARAATLIATGKAAGAVSIKVAALTEGVIKTMLLTKLKIATAVALAVSFLAVGGGVMTYSRLPAESGNTLSDESPHQTLAKVPAPVKSDKELIQGTWQVTQAKAGGTHLAWEGTTNQRWSITDQSVTIRYDSPDSGDVEPVEFTYELGDPDKKPREIDMKQVKGPWKGDTFLGIYELKDDQLKISYHHGEIRPDKRPGSNRPSTFPITGEDDRGLRYYVLKRVPKDEEGAKPDPVEEELKKLEGTWKYVSMEMRGKARLEREFMGFTVVIKGDSMIVEKDGKSIGDGAKMTINPTKKPKTMDVVVTGKPDEAGIRGRAIYELDGDTLRICVGDEERPDEFKTTAETGTTQIMVLKREKRSPKDKDGGTPKADKEDVAWGETVNGLQAGIGTRPAGKTKYQLGETVHLVVKIRNIGKEPREFSYPSEPFDGLPPVVTDATGKRRQVAMPPIAFYLPRYSTKTLKPGEEFDLGGPTLGLTPAAENGNVKQPTLAGEPGKVKVAYRYDPWNRLLAAGREKEILSTGSVELEIKEAAKAETEKKSEISWGETVNDLQAGIGTRPAGKTAYRKGETIEFVVKVRNVGKEPRDFSYPSQRFDDLAPVVIDASGKRLTVVKPLVEFFRRVLETTTLKAGEEMEFGGPRLVLLPATVKGKDKAPTLDASPGSVKVSYPDLEVTPAKDPEGKKLSTGSIELEIKEAAEPEKEKAGDAEFVKASIKRVMNDNGEFLERDQFTTSEHPDDLAKLLAFFPGVGEGKESKTKGEWKGAVFITLKPAKGKAVEVAVHYNLKTWNEGHGDWDTKPGLGKYLDELFRTHGDRMEKELFIRQWRVFKSSDLFANEQWEITKDRILNHGAKGYELFYKLDQSADPPAIDLIFKPIQADEDHKPYTLKGTYYVEYYDLDVGCSLILILASTTDGERPTKISDRKDEKIVHLVPIPKAKD